MNVNAKAIAFRGGSSWCDFFRTTPSQSPFFGDALHGETAVHDGETVATPKSIDICPARKGEYDQTLRGNG